MSELRRPNFNEFGALDSESLRSVNESLVLNLIRERQPISRVELARLTHLKESTISSITRILIDEGLVFETDLGASSGGRRPRMLRINANRSMALGVDVGVRRTAIAISNFNGEILAKTTFPTGPEPRAFLSRLSDGISSMIHSHVPTSVRLEGIGLSLPGLLDRVAGTIVYSANLDWRDVAVGSTLRRRFTCDLVFEDNVRTSGLAHIWFGSLGELRLSHVLNLVVNEGIGAAIIIGGHLYPGATLGAGQFGHMSLDPRGPQCACGNRGCWELYASDTATLRRYAKYTGASRCLSNMAELIDRASQRDPAALRAIRSTGEYLGVGIALLVNTLNPEMIVIDGEISRCWEIIEPEMWAVIQAKALAPSVKVLRLRPSPIKESSSLVGAISLMVCRRFAVSRRGKAVETASSEATG